MKLTENFHIINQMTKRFRLAVGGMGSSKTFSILQILYLYARKHPNTVITCVTDTYPRLKDGMLSDMAKIDDDFYTNFNKSSKDLTVEDSVIQFRNFDHLDINAGRGSRRDILFANEANRLSFAALEPFIDRTDK